MKRRWPSFNHFTSRKEARSSFSPHRSPSRSSSGPWPSPSILWFVAGWPGGTRGEPAQRGSHHSHHSLVGVRPLLPDSGNGLRSELQDFPSRGRDPHGDPYGPDAGGGVETRSPARGGLSPGAGEEEIEENSHPP